MASSSNSLDAAIQDLASSGMTPEILGVPMSTITQYILPLDIDTARRFGKKNVLLTHNEQLRSTQGYFWEYNTALRYKNLDAEFYEYKDGEPVVDTETGLPKPAKYLSGTSPHLFIEPIDKAANESPKGVLWFTEGEKKKRLLTLLCAMRLKHHTTFKASFLNRESKYGVFGASGVQQFLCTPEWETLRVKGKIIYIAFDADWLINEQIPLAELKLTAALIARGASVKKIKSLSWTIDSGKGIDDYLYNVYRQVLGEDPAFQANGSAMLEPIVPAHPMIDGLNHLIKFSTHPFQKYAQFGIDYLCYGLASVYRAGLSLSPSQQEDILLFLNEKVFKTARMSVLRATLAQAIKREGHTQAVAARFIITEQRHGERFAQEHQHHLRWNLTRDGWNYWDGTTWVVDEQEQAFQYCKQTLAGIGKEIAEADIPDEQRHALRDKMITTVERKAYKENVLVEARRGVAGMSITENVFDQNPSALNCQNGILYLDKLSNRHGGFGKHTSEAYCSMIMGTSYQPDAVYTGWQNFINLIFDNKLLFTDEFLYELTDNQVHEDIVSLLSAYQQGDTELHQDEFFAAMQQVIHEGTPTLDVLGTFQRGQDLTRSRNAFVEYCFIRARKRQGVVDFLQQLCGISLSGFNSEKVLLFCYGPGGDNGKTTFFNVMERVLGTYYFRINIESLLYHPNRGVNNDEIADMKGKRMVVTSEVSEGSLNISLIKTLTGAEGKIKASRKYEHPIEFSPTHTLWMFGNQMPRVHIINDPIWKRIKVIRFTVSIPDVLSHDQLLPQDQAVDMLCQELPGILKWCLGGWQSYREKGLLHPHDIEMESLRYKTEQDKIGLYFQENCVRSTPEEPREFLKIRRTKLFEDYISWCGSNHEKPIGKIKFYREVESHGAIIGTGGANEHYFNGIALKSMVSEEEDAPLFSTTN